MSLVDPPSEAIPSRAELRRLLDVLLPGDNDLNGFVYDHFPTVLQRFQPGLLRNVKLDLLLQFADIGELHRLLRERGLHQRKRRASEIPDFGFERARHAELFGRDDLLSTLLAACQQDGWVVVSGAAGVGKTALLVHLLHPDARARLADLGPLPAHLRRLAAGLPGAEGAGPGDRSEGAGPGDRSEGGLAPTWWLPARWPYRGGGLEEVVAGLVDGGRARLVAVAGPVGAGRGRVVEELIQSLQARVDSPVARVCAADRLGAALGSEHAAWLAAWIAGSPAEATVIGLPEAPGWPGELAEGSDDEDRAARRAAVLVAAPNEGQVGVAMGPGVMLEMRDYVDLEKDRLKGFIEIGLPYCKGACNAAQTEMVLGAAEHIAHDVSHWDFQLRYQNLGELMAKYEEISNARMNGQDIEPEQDPTWRKIVRIEGKIVSRDPASSGQAKWINDIRQANVGAPIHVTTADGRNLLVCVDPHTEALMTSKLEEGESYLFIAREASLSQNPEDTLSFDLLSYDLAAR